MIDGSEKRNRQLAFELQNSHVCEKRSKSALKNAFLGKKSITPLKLYSETPPHGHLGYTVTSLLRPLFLAAGQSVFFELNTLSCQKNPYQYGHPLIRPNFFGPLVTVLTRFHCISNRKSAS